MFTLVVGQHGHLHTVFGIPADVAYNGSFVLFNASPYQCTITSFGGFVEELYAEIGFGVRCLCYNEQTGSIFVNAVHQTDMRVVGIVIGMIFHVPGYGVHQSSVVVTVPRMHNKSGRFIHYHEVFILINNIEWDVFGNDLIFIAWTVHHNGNDVHRLYLVAAFDRLVVSHYKTCFC